jgi:hypothetical protein
VYTVPAIGSGDSPRDAIRPAIPDGTDGVFYKHAGQFLVATAADLTGVQGVTELLGDDIDAACATWGIDPAALGVAT